MKISLDWIREYVDWDWSVEELVEKLTMSGTEVEAVHQTGVNIANIVTAKVLSSSQHPNADRLSVCQVDDGSGNARQIVCGAKNYQVGDVVPLALPGAEFPGGFKIKPTKMRGEKSEGMMCSAKELGLSEDAEGLLILDKGTPLGKPVSELFPGETVLELEVTPNRPDLLSYKGMAREWVAIGAKSKPRPEVKTLGFDVPKDWALEVRDTKGCPRYTAQLIANVQVKPSPDWLKKRLESVGLRPINNIVDITNYVLLETGQPLHAFDADKLQGRKIEVRRAHAKEKFSALDGRTYELEESDLVIADAKDAVALAGVMGGELTGVTESTKNVLLESALFDAPMVRATSRKLGLISDSSYRFERGVDPAAIDSARDRATSLILELAGGTAEKSAWQTAPCQPARKEIPFRPERARTFLSMDVSDKRMEEIFTNLEIEKCGEKWLAPTWRPDLEREVDLIEEVARLEGLSNLKKHKLNLGAAPTTSADLTEDRHARLRQLLVSLGFYEAMTGSLLPKTDNAVALANPMNEDGMCLRTDLLSSILPCVAHNLSREQKDVRLFEIGRVYVPDGSKVREETHLVIVSAGRERAEHWSEPERAMDVFSLKGVLDAVAGRFPDLPQPSAPVPVAPALLKKHGIKTPVFCAELVLPAVEKTDLKKFQPLPAYPSIQRDLAFVLDESVPQSAVESAVSSAGIVELENVRCFDFFQDKTGKKLPKGKKSLAYALTYRSAERTLKENEVSAWEQKIISAVEKKTGAKLRD